MAYEFNIPSQEYLFGLLTGNRGWRKDEDERTLEQLMANQPPIEQPQPPVEQSQTTAPQAEPPEQRGGKEIVDSFIENMWAQPQNQANYRTSNNSYQAPNPYALQLQRGILAAKQAYDAAKNDEARQVAQAAAGLLRNKADAAGLDMNGYGTDVSLADALNNFASQEARDIMQALRGKYAETSDQYYRRQYGDLILEGYSPRKARAIADSLKQDYQAERVQYLDGLLNSYGREGLVTNEYGNLAIARLADENPERASFYAQIYPNAKDAYTRMNTLKDKDIDQQHQLEQLAVGHKYGLENIDAQTAGNIKYADATHKNTLQRDAIQQGYKKENDYDQYRYSTWLARNQGAINAELAKIEGAITQQNQTQLAQLKHKLGIETKEYDFLLADRKHRQNIVQLSTLADYLGYEGERKSAFMTAALGIKMPDPNTGKFDKASVESGKKFHDMLDADEKNILKQIENLGFDEDPQTVAQLQAKLADIRATKQQLEDIMGEQFGMQAPTSHRDIPPFTGQEAQDLKTLSEMLRYMDEQNLSEDDIKYYVRQWVPQDRTDLYVEGLIRKVRGN